MNETKQSTGSGPETETKLESGYRVMVADNYKYMDPDEVYCAGEYASYEEAVAVAKQIVRSSVSSSEGSTPEEMMSSYRMFGDDPYIEAFGEASAPDEDRFFSAWDYADVFASLIRR